MPSGYTSDLPDDILLDVAVLSRDVASTPTTFGVSRGGLTFRPLKETRQVEFDGRRSDIEGLDRVIRYGGEISGTFLQVGLAQLDDFEPGASVTTSTATAVAVTYTITPKAASALFASGDYIDNLTMTFQRGGGGTCVVKFTKALCGTYELSGQDNNEAEVQATFSVRLPAATAATSTDTAPYTILLIDPV